MSVQMAGTYRAGQNIGFRAVFDETVDVTDTPKLNITIDTTTKSVDYVSGSGTKTLLFNYTVLAVDIDTDGIASTGITLSSGTIKDTAGNASVAADLTPTTPFALATVLVDGKAPTLTDVSADAGTYTVGDTIGFRAVFDETVDASSDAKLNITIDTTTKSVDYVSGSGTKTLLFNYTVLAVDIDTDGIASTGITLSSGTIKDTAGNASVAADLTPTTPFALATVLVDGKAPTLTDVSADAGTYIVGDTIGFRAVFDENG